MDFAGHVVHSCLKIKKGAVLVKILMATRLGQKRREESKIRPPQNKQKFLLFPGHKSAMGHQTGLQYFSGERI